MKNKKHMIYISFWFYLFIISTLAVYYLAPVKIRWGVLLFACLGFYYKVCPGGLGMLLVTAAVSYLVGLILNRYKNKWFLICGILLTIAPWVMLKTDLLKLLEGSGVSGWIVPLGLSFYTLQLVAYLVDIYKGKICSQRNIFHYLLFVTYFPQIVQGPIPRYEQLERNLYEGHKFDEKTFSRGLRLIVWGFFLKLMIADKAAVVVNSVFDNPDMYAGLYILIAGGLYSIVLYTDFLACVSISKGVSWLFGIQLSENFAHPYFSTSIKEFWRRWHISLSAWLRDYIYIPLGGNRRGSKYLNLLITFAVSGIWHGSGLKYLCWGLLHGIYQIVGNVTASVKSKIYDLMGMYENTKIRKVVKQIGTFFWVTIGWIIFRADGLENGIKMIVSMFRTFNPWILFDDSLLSLGLDWKEWGVLLVSIGILFAMSRKQEQVSISQYIAQQHIVVRWGLYIVAIIAIMLFGTYGFGYNAQDFIYGGF